MATGHDRKDDHQSATTNVSDVGSESSHAGAADRLRDSHGAVAATVFLDQKPGATAQDSSPAVDRALGDAGRGGESHPSGATFHTGPVAEAAADALGARAFTAGSNVYFGAGEHQPGTPSGDQLIRHELTHVEQGRGMASPQPGNYRVSDPGDAAEVAARSNAGGAQAAAGTIHRDVKDSKVSGPNGDLRMLMALSVGADDARKMWADLKDSDKRTVSASTMGYAISKVQVDAIPWMKSARLDFSKGPELGRAILKEADPSIYTAPLKANNLWDSFLGGLPNHGGMTDDEVKKMGTSFVEKENDVPQLTRMFTKAYPSLQNTAYANFFRAAAWTAPPIKRLYKTLSTYLPINAAQTLTGGFYLGRDEKEDGKWVPLSYAWYSAGRCVVPAPGNKFSDDKGVYFGQYTMDGFEMKDGTKRTTHGMSGGGKTSGAVLENKGTTVKSTDGKSDVANPSLTHFDSSILHEVGHGVGARSGADNWVATGGGLGNFRQEKDIYAWGKELFGDTSKAADAARPDPKAPWISALDAMRFMAETVAGGAAKTMPKGFKQGGKVSKWLLDPANSAYASSNLGKYWQSTPANKDGSYHPLRVAAHAGATTGDRMFVWLSRWDNAYCSYKKAAFDTRVSFYSMSSPYEWFAEQYTEYYRTNKQSPRMDDEMKRKMDEIDAMKWDGKSKTLASKTSSFDPATKDGMRKVTGDGNGPNDRQRVPFPWDES